MGCGSSTATRSDVVAAAPATVTQLSVAVVKNAIVTPAAVPATDASVASASSASSPVMAFLVTVDAPPAAAAEPTASQSAVLAAYRSDVALGSIDSPPSAFLTADDLERVVEQLASCSLFDGARAEDLEITPAALVELIFVSGSVEGLIDALQALEKQGARFESMRALPGALHAHALESIKHDVALLPSTVAGSVEEVYAVLAAQSCGLYPYSRVPTVPTVHVPDDRADDEHDLDFMQANVLLIEARMRLLFLNSVFLVHLVHVARGDAATVLGHLALAENQYELPSLLLKAVAEYRARSTEAVTAVRAKQQEGAVPADLLRQVAPLEKALTPAEGCCTKLSPLIPGCSALTGTLHHLQAYLSRFLPLLQECRRTAEEGNIPPESDDAAAKCLGAYLIPFVRLAQPFLVSLRPYLAGLQPFFGALQPFLASTHEVFTLMHPLLVQVAPHVTKEESFLLDDSFVAFLRHNVRVLVLLHPLLRTLHPLAQSLLAFLHELLAFLAQVQALLDLLKVYQTEPFEEAAPKSAAEHSQSSIAVPWFDAVSRPSSAEATLSAPRFLSKHGRFVLKLQPLITQLRPFAGEVSAFVDTYVPHVAQLAPFYSANLKQHVVALLPLLLPTSDDKEAAKQA